MIVIGFLLAGLFCGFPLGMSCERYRAEKTVTRQEIVDIHTQEANDREDATPECWRSDAPR